MLLHSVLLLLCLGTDPTGKSFPDLPHTPANVQLYEAFMVKLGRKYHTVPNPLHYPLAHSCFLNLCWTKRNAKKQYLKNDYIWGKFSHGQPYTEMTHPGL